MPGPSNMELRSSSQQGRIQEEQSEQGITEATASVNEVEALRRQLETLKASRDAEYRRRRELEEQIDRQPQPVATPRQVWEPAPRIPVPQMDKFDGNTPVSEWWTTFMAYIALHTTGSKKYWKCHFLLIISDIYWYCTVSAENCWYLLIILLLLLIITVGSDIYWYLLMLLLWALIITDIYWDLLLVLRIADNYWELQAGDF